MRSGATAARPSSQVAGTDSSDQREGVGRGGAVLDGGGARPELGGQRRRADRREQQGRGELGADGERDQRHAGRESGEDQRQRHPAGGAGARAAERGGHVVEDRRRQLERRPDADHRPRQEEDRVADAPAPAGSGRATAPRGSRSSPGPARRRCPAARWRGRPPARPASSAPRGAAPPARPPAARPPSRAGRRRSRGRAWCRAPRARSPCGSDDEFPRSSQRTRLTRGTPRVSTAKPASPSHPGPGRPAEPVPGRGAGHARADARPATLPAGQQLEAEQHEAEHDEHQGQQRGARAVERRCGTGPGSRWSGSGS